MTVCIRASIPNRFIYNVLEEMTQESITVDISRDVLGLRIRNRNYRIPEFQKIVCDTLVSGKGGV